MINVHFQLLPIWFKFVRIAIPDAKIGSIEFECLEPKVLAAVLIQVEPPLLGVRDFSRYASNALFSNISDGGIIGPTGRLRQLHENKPALSPVLLVQLHNSVRCCSRP